MRPPQRPTLSPIPSNQAQETLTSSYICLKNGDKWQHLIHLPPVIPQITQNRFYQRVRIIPIH